MTSEPREDVRLLAEARRLRERAAELERAARRIAGSTSRSAMSAETPRTIVARGRGTGDPLSEQQLAIARLAAHGLTNRQIGERLFLSPRTVGTHLYRAFPKLGVTSRHQLPSALSYHLRRAAQDLRP